MSASGINEGMRHLAHLNQTRQINTQARIRDENHEHRDAIRVREGRQGGIASAISQALAQVGVNGPSQSSNSEASDTSIQESKQAVRAFMQDLFAALRPNAHGPRPVAESSTDTSDTTVNDITGTPPPAYSGLENRLNNLIQQLSSSTPSDSNSPETPATSSPSLAKLEQDFQNLVNSLGASGDNATLGNFLQAFSQNLHSANPVGNIVSTQA